MSVWYQYVNCQAAVLFPELKKKKEKVNYIRVNKEIYRSGKQYLWTAFVLAWHISL